MKEEERVADWSSYKGSESNGNIKKDKDAASLTESSHKSASIGPYDDFDNDLKVPQGTHESVDMAKVAVKEDEAVGWSRLLLACVLMLAMISMTTATYIILRNENKADFESQFRNHASEIETILIEKINGAMETVKAFGVSVTSLVKSSNMSWPFVTIPDYEAKSLSLLSLTNAHTAAFITHVKHDQLYQWLEYYNQNIYQWMQESNDYHGWSANVSAIPINANSIRGPPEENSPDYDLLEGSVALAWQIAPFSSPYVASTNFNLLSMSTIADAYVAAEAIRATAMNFVVRNQVGRAESQMIHPIFEHVSGTGNRGRMVGSIWLGVDWNAFVQDLLPEETSGIIVVLKSKCDTISASYLINGTEANFLGNGDFHDHKYDYMEVSSNFINFDIPDGVELPNGRCIPSLTLHIYPSDEYMNSFDNNDDLLYAGWVVLIFALTSVVFFIYDSMVRIRQKKVMSQILRQHKIVSDMFPARFRDKLYEDESSSHNQEGSTSEYKDRSKTIAELYPSATVMFADISGFTAWSSTREPFQVFMLLESIYLAFDELAQEHGVFKVETVGDCYVAVAGLPDPREDHVLAIAAFARNCVHKMSTLTKTLEVNLGPDTGDLSLRVGIHSGQVTAGILRGERSRFQLFGDTVNTAARMEATGEEKRIQLSEKSADMLRDYGKGHWIKPRKGTVEVKGKGKMQTYWLMTRAEQRTYKMKGRDRTSKSKTMEEMIPLAEGTEEVDDDWEFEPSSAFNVLGLEDRLSSKMARLVEWNVDILSNLLKQIMAARGQTTCKLGSVPPQHLILAEKQVGRGETVLEEFQEIISLPKIGVEELRQRVDLDSVQLGEVVVAQLRDLITRIASMYRDNHFHNFEHASHVTSSVRKLLSRIVKHDNADDSTLLNLIDLSGHSYGITSDPLTQFAVVFSAVIHDADHPGVTNAQLVKEKVPLAQKFKDKSVAEQNSVALVWDLLMEDRYRELRSCIYTNEVELRRFRQLVVNTVMATDICDKELGALRKARWNKAFAKEALDKLAVTLQDDTNRKATIVIEHLIQASDVSHTMQHWAVYKKWNERFFMECYAAFKAGRAGSDPSVGWYQGEIGFFDFYVIPLAKKLESCGVFGVSSDEYLNYAMSNRDEWVREGEAMVRNYMEKIDDLESKKTSDTESLYEDSVSVIAHETLSGSQRSLQSQQSLFTDSSRSC